MMAQILQYIFKNTITLEECDAHFNLLELRDTEGNTAIRCAIEYVLKAPFLLFFSLLSFLLFVYLLCRKNYKSAHASCLEQLYTELENFKFSLIFTEILYQCVCTSILSDPSPRLSSISYRPLLIVYAGPEVDGQYVSTTLCLVIPKLTSVFFSSGSLFLYLLLSHSFPLFLFAHHRRSTSAFIALIGFLCSACNLNDYHSDVPHLIRRSLDLISRCENILVLISLLFLVSLLFCSLFS